MRNVCQKKCFENLQVADLQTGELSCLDRCIAKFSQATEVVDELFKQQQQGGMQLS